MTRARGAEVSVHLLGQPPTRPYVVVGHVEAIARSRNSNLDNLLAHAARGARELGGDAIVDVAPSESATGKGRLMLTASVARWDQVNPAASG